MSLGLVPRNVFSEKRRKKGQFDLKTGHSSFAVYSHPTWIAMPYITSLSEVLSRAYVAY